MERVQEGDWWGYSYCVNERATQFHPNSRMINVMDQLVHSAFARVDHDSKSLKLYQKFVESKPDCYSSQGGLTARSVAVIVACCNDDVKSNGGSTSFGKSKHSHPDNYIVAAFESEACMYEIQVCSRLLCVNVLNDDNDQVKSNSEAQHAKALSPVDGVSANDSSYDSPYFGCYGAYTPNYPSCTGYERVGYTCRGPYCAYDGARGCIASCEVCAVFYPHGIFNESSGKCILSARSRPHWINHTETIQQRERVKGENCSFEYTTSIHY